MLIWRKPLNPGAEITGFFAAIRETALTSEKDVGKDKPQRIRARLKLSQAAFAGLMGVSLRTVQDWEQGRCKPSGPAEPLLRIADQHPEVFTQLI